MARPDLSLSPFDVGLDELVGAARVAEDAGFDAVWTYDHISGVSGGGGRVLDPWVTLSAIATSTDTIGLGPLVLNATIRHPAHIAVAAASFQELSHGRLILGMGAGAGRDTYGRELEMVGLPLRSAAERRARTEEAIAAVRSLWRGKPWQEGLHHPLIDATGFHRPHPEPRIIVGANGPKMAALAGRVADGVNFHWWEQDLEGLAAVARQTAGDPAFEVTVEAPLEPNWLVGDGRLRLERLGVARIMYRWNITLGIEAITDAARWLAR